MASELLILRISKARDYEQIEIVAFYPIDPVITTATDPPVVVKPTPADTLPPICDELDLVPQAYKNQLDAGLAMFEVGTVKKREGQTEQEVLQLVRDKYPTRAADKVAEERRRYERVGTWMDV